MQFFAGLFSGLFKLLARIYGKLLGALFGLGELVASIINLCTSKTSAGYRIYTDINNLRAHLTIESSTSF